MEHEKYKSMTSGAGLPSKLAARLKELKRNPLNGSVVMVQVVDVNKRRGKKGKSRKGKGKGKNKNAEEKKEEEKEEKEEVRGHLDTEI